MGFSLKAYLTLPELVLAGACTLLAGALIYELGSALPVTSAPIVPFGSQDVAINLPMAVSIPSPSLFDAINAKPIFNPARSPIAVSSDGTAPGAPPPLPNAVVIGIILDSKTRLAMVKADASAPSASVHEGDQLGGWIVSDITADGIVLRFGDVSRSLFLNGGAGSPPRAGVGPLQAYAGQQVPAPRFFSPNQGQAPRAIAPIVPHSNVPMNMMRPPGSGPSPATTQ